MLANTNEMLEKARLGRYAVGQFNINNLEWIKAILQAARDARAPVILGVTAAAAQWMGGLGAVRGLAAALARDLRADIPIGLHLDHSSEHMCYEAIGAGFTSVMFDGSKMPFEKNLEICAAMAPICAQSHVSLEAELGSPAGEEDGISGTGEHADPGQCGRLAKTGITSLAASIGNIHGQYPTDWPGLDFDLLERIRAAASPLPLVLHGGTGIPEVMVKRAISLGICKINVNTECQQAFAQALREYFAQGQDAKPKGYGMQKIMGAGLAAIRDKVIEKMNFFGCAGKAD